MNLRKFIVTFFGSGLSPVAPGTMGSLAAAVGLYGISLVVPSGWYWQGACILGMLVAGGLCVALGRWAVEYFDREDPQAVVLDEVAGICLTCVGLPMQWGSAITIVLAFGAFRLFDVTKPPPCHRLEKLPAGWGILMDDLAAAVYANLVCQIVLRVHF